MAITQCRECDREISSQATICPHCGATVPNRKAIVNKVALVVIAVAAVIWLPSYLNACSSDLSELADDFRAIGN